jgi:outer membrane protein assembly factor BamA
MLATRRSWGWFPIRATLPAWGLSLFASTYAVASQPLGDVRPDAALDSESLDKSQGIGFFNDTNFLVVPIPVSNPTIGSGGALAGAMLFKTDEKSKPSTIGVAGFYTSNGSWGGGAMADIWFHEDRYEAKLTGGYANISYDFYGIGSAAGQSNVHVSLTQSGEMFQGAFSARVAPDFYLGAQARYMTIKTKFNLPDIAGDLLDNGGPLAKLKNNIYLLGLTAAYDSRNNSFAPSSGALIKGEADFGLHDFATRNTYLRTTASYSRYDELDPDVVLASHASLCMVGGQVPIFDLCMFGSNNDLRGYATGRYQDKAMFAAQEELRVHAFWRIGFVAFGGIGSVAPSVAKFQDMLVAGGVGVRILVSKDYGVNVGLDGAINKDGDKSFYVHVGEAF